MWDNARIHGVEGVREKIKHVVKRLRPDRAESFTEAVAAGVESISADDAGPLRLPPSIQMSTAIINPMPQ